MAQVARTEAVIDTLEGSIKKMLDAYTALKSKYKSLESENEQLKLALMDRNEEFKNFQNQQKISKIVTSLAEDTQKTSELKLKINEYIREIDKCIAYLGEA